MRIWWWRRKSFVSRVSIGAKDEIDLDEDSSDDEVPATYTKAGGREVKLYVLG